MIIRELQVLSEGLWESVKTDLKFFSSIQSYVKKLAEFDFSESSNLEELILYVDKIEEFFDVWRAKGGDFYIPPSQTSRNDSTVKRILQLAHQLKNLSEEQLGIEIEKFKPKKQVKSSGEGKVFIGHGRSKLWARLQVYLKDELHLETLSYETESHTSETITNVIDDFLNKASYAILILTGEDETAEGNFRARQNVVHEAGLFQGRLGFNKVVLLKQDKIEEFTNVAGLQHIPFIGSNIEQTFYELNRTLKKAGLIK